MILAVVISFRTPTKTKERLSSLIKTETLSISVGSTIIARVRRRRGVIMCFSCRGSVLRVVRSAKSVIPSSFGCIRIETCTSSRRVSSRRTSISGLVARRTNQRFRSNRLANQCGTFRVNHVWTIRLAFPLSPNTASVRFRCPRWSLRTARSVWLVALDQSESCRVNRRLLLLLLRRLRRQRWGRRFPRESTGFGCATIVCSLFIP